MTTPDAPDAIDEIYDRIESHFGHDDVLVKGWLHTPVKSLPAEMTPNEMLKARRILELLAYVREITQVTVAVVVADTACPS